MRKYILVCTTFMLLTFVSCKKKSIESADTATSVDFLKTHMANVPATGTVNQKVLDTMYLAALNVYYWNRTLPTYTEFNPRKYLNSNLLTGMNATLFGITQIPKNASNNNIAYEFTGNERSKYSFIDELDKNATLSSIKTTASVGDSGIGDDFGFNALVVNYENSTTSDFGKEWFLRLSVVYPGSPAAKQNLKRGMRIYKVNGRAIDEFDMSTAPGFNIDALNAFFGPAMSGNSIILELKDENNKVINVTLNKTTYTSSPVINYKILDVAGKKVGYLAYMSFQDIDKTKAEIDKAFDAFETADVQMENIIFDIRFNGGGYVAAAEYIMNRLAGGPLNGSVMYSQIYNEDMQKGKLDFLKNFKFRDGRETLNNYDFSKADNIVKFESKGNLNKVKNVYFLVSHGTASASELVYNALKPYLNCVLIGLNTYGKPVGFFPLEIGGYNVYFSMFVSKNSKDEGSYFTGIFPDYELQDPSEFDFGDVRDVYIKRAVDLISGITFTKSTPRAAALTPTQPMLSFDRVPKGGMILRAKDLKLKKIQ